MKFRRSRKHRQPWSPDPSTLGITRVLLVLQAGFAFLNALTATLIGLMTGLIVLVAPAAIVTAVGAIVVLALIPRIERGSRRARKLVVIGEWFVLCVALFELGLALVLTRLPLDLVPTLTRVVLPIVVLRLLRRPRVARRRLNRRSAAEVPA